MPNPWINLQVGTPLAAACDQRLLAASQGGTFAFERWGLKLDLFPEPYIGDPRTADVVLLSGNPGWDQNDSVWHRREDFGVASLANLRHEHQAFPFYMLDPRFEESPGGAWWRGALRDVLGEVSDDERVAQRIAVIESFPYHSEWAEFPADHGLPSQDYSNELARFAHRRGALVLAMRAAEYWAGVLGVPRGNLCEAANARSITVSSGNIGSAAYREVVYRIRA